MGGNRSEQGWWPGALDIASGLIAKAVVLAWFVGLAWFNWLAPNPAPIPWQGHLVLIAMVVLAVILIGTPVFLTVRSLSNLFESRTVPPAIIFGFGMLVSAALSFLAAAIAVRFVAGLPVAYPGRGIWFFLTLRH